MQETRWGVLLFGRDAVGVFYNRLGYTDIFLFCLLLFSKLKKKKSKKQQQ